MASPYHWFTQYEQHQADMRRGLIKTPWGGPKKQAYLYESGEPVILDITDAGDKYKIAGMPSGYFAVATQLGNDRWTVQHNAVGRIGWVYVKGDFNSLESATEAAVASLTALRDEEARIAASPVLQLERELKSRDWTGHMSDDFAYWSAANAQDRRLKTIIPQCPPDEVRRLWAQYAPGSEYTCPV